MKVSSLVMCLAALAVPSRLWGIEAIKPVEVNTTPPVPVDSLDDNNSVISNFTLGLVLEVNIVNGRAADKYRSRIAMVPKVPLDTTVTGDSKSFSFEALRSGERPLTVSGSDETVNALEGSGPQLLENGVLVVPLPVPQPVEVIRIRLGSVHLMDAITKLTFLTFCEKHVFRAWCGPGPDLPFRHNR